MNPRRPTALRIIEGNPGHRPLPENEPQPELGAEAPAWLSVDAAKNWPIVAKMLTDIGVLTVIDATALALFCEVFARWKNANDQVVRSGAVIKLLDGTVMLSPFLKVATQAHDQMIKLLTEFGMTPASRAKVSVAKAPKQEKTGLKKYL